jgi:hypothetical protein
MTPHSPPPPLLPARELDGALSRARRDRTRAVAVMVSAAHCPWCGLVIEEQLIPRIRSRAGPALDVIVFDLADTRPIAVSPLGVPPSATPSAAQNQGRGPTPAPVLRFSPAQWAQTHGYRVAPTVAMVGLDARPLFAPLVGYSSRDFYGAYLDDQVARAQRYWNELA